jgi:HlyD family secretion protein
MMLKYGLPLLALVALGFAIYFVVKSDPGAANQDPRTVPAPKVPGATLAGAGIVEPVTQNIAVGSPLPGVVTWVIDAGEIGKVLEKETPLFRLDDRNLKADLEVKKAALASSNAQLARLESMPRKEELVPPQAKLLELEPALIEARKLLDAADLQIEKAAISKADWGKYKANYQILLAQQAKAKGDLDLVKAGAWKPDIDIAKAAVVQAQAQLEQVKTELERLEIKAPITSTLLQVNVRVGEFVGAQPGQSLLLLGNLNHIHVRVDIDEHDASRFRPGMAGVGYLRGQPDVSFPMKFVRVEPYLVPRKSLTGDNTERVDTRVLQVIYQMTDSTDLKQKIFVGRQMDVFIGDLEVKKPAN